MITVRGFGAGIILACVLFIQSRILFRVPFQALLRRDLFPGESEAYFGDLDVRTQTQLNNVLAAFGHGEVSCLNRCGYW